MTDASRLAESLRAMRRNARRHYGPELGQTSHSITMDSTRLDDLSDAADMLEKMRAELGQWKRCAAQMTLARLPEPANRERVYAGHGGEDVFDWYTPQQMREYARQHVYLCDERQAAEIKALKEAAHGISALAGELAADLDKANGGADDPHLSARFEVTR